jgi:hemin uptake protein HemP
MDRPGKRNAPESSLQGAQRALVSPEALRIDVSALLQGRKEAVLVFAGSEYRLKITRQGKLLLTK